MKNQKPTIKPSKKRYYLEIIAIIVGLLIFGFGIIEETHHDVSISYNSKGMMSVHTGLMTCFYGFLMIFGGCASIYGKRKRKL